MIASIVIFLVGSLIAWIELRNLRKKGEKKEQWVFLILLGLGIGLSMLKAVGVNIPNPMDWAIAFYRPFYEMITGFFGQNGS